MDISGNNNNRTGTLIVVQRKNYLTPIKQVKVDCHDMSREYLSLTPGPCPQEMESCKSLIQLRLSRNEDLVWIMAHTLLTPGRNKGKLHPPFAWTPP